MAILDLILDSFPTSGGASTLDLTIGTTWLTGHRLLPLPS
ncbi:MAG: hypothetical protein QOG19_946 [Mycobacterium sp.]|nr:hypothetical protein [Mycobacterium sp.]